MSKDCPTKEGHTCEVSNVRRGKHVMFHFGWGMHDMVKCPTEERTCLVECPT